MSVCVALESSIFAFSAASFRRCSASRSLRRSMPCLSSEFVGEIVDDAHVEVVAARMRVAVGRLHLEHAVADFEDRNVEGAAAKIVHGDLAVPLLSRP